MSLEIPLKKYSTFYHNDFKDRFVTWIKEMVPVLKRFFQTADNLSNKATIGIIWMTFRQILLQGLLLLKILLVANLLGPEIFGIFGLALLSVILLEQFSQWGIQFALIHKQNKQEYYNTAWTLNIIRGGILFSLIVVLNKGILRLFDIQGSFYVLIAVGSTLILEGLVNIGTIEFIKELNYSKEFMFRAIPDLANVLSTIILAIIFVNIWALVAGLLIERIFRVFLSYTIHDYKPKFHLDKIQIKELFVYGKWIFFLGILGFLIFQGADLFVGIILGASLLAIYQIAFKLATLPVTSLSGLIATVSIPTYAKLQENITSSSRTFKITFYVQIIFFSIYTSVLYPVIDLFIKLILGPEWVEINKIIGILFIAGLVSIIISSIDPIFIANGIQKRLVKWQFAGILLFLSLVFPVLSTYNLRGLAWLMVAVITFISFGYLYEIFEMLKLQKLKMLIETIQILILGAVNLIILELIQLFIQPNSLVTLLIFIVAGIILYLVISWISNKISKLHFLREFELIWRSTQKNSR